MRTLAVVFERPESMALREVGLIAPGDADVVVDVEWSSISAGTERLLWSGRMPDFPGMGYPLVPGYETVGRVREAGFASGRHPGERVFVPGARCFDDARGLFGGAAAHLVVPGERAVPIPDVVDEPGVLFALAATAHHALAGGRMDAPLAIVGHGALGRLMARIAMALGAPPPTVWETHPARRAGVHPYRVVEPQADAARDYRTIYDVSGDASVLDTLIGHLAPGGHIVLGGFYSQPLAFQFAPAFRREAHIRVAAEWLPDDMAAVVALVSRGALDLGGLITHRAAVGAADAAYGTAFSDPTCVKMVLDWRAVA